MQNRSGGVANRGGATVGAAVSSSSGNMGGGTATSTGTGGANSAAAAVNHAANRAKKPKMTDQERLEVSRKWSLLFFRLIQNSFESPVLFF